MILKYSPVVKCAPSTTARQFCRRGEWTFTSQGELFCITAFLYYTHGGDHTHSKHGDLIQSLGSRPHIFVSVPDHTFLSRFQTTHFCLVYLQWGVWSYRECPLSFPACQKCISLLVVSNVEASSSSLHTSPPLSLYRWFVWTPMLLSAVTCCLKPLTNWGGGEQTWPPLCEEKILNCRLYQLLPNLPTIHFYIVHFSLQKLMPCKSKCSCTKYSVKSSSISSWYLVYKNYKM